MSKEDLMAALDELGEQVSAGEVPAKAALLEMYGLGVHDGVGIAKDKAEEVAEGCRVNAKQLRWANQNTLADIQDEKVSAVQAVVDAIGEILKQ